MDEGIIYVAYGAAAQREMATSLFSLRQHHDYPVHVVEGEAAKGQGIPISRAAKLHLDQVTPFRHTLYLDADTRIRGDLSTGFKMLADGWDLVIAPSGPAVSVVLVGVVVLICVLLSATPIVRLVLLKQHRVN